MSTFKERLALGIDAERRLLKWLCRTHGFSCLHVGDTDRLPAIYDPEPPAVGERSRQVPDALLFSRGAPFAWCDVKAKCALGWNLKQRKWVACLDTVFCDDMEAVANSYGLPVCLLIAVTSDKPRLADIAKGAPHTSPAGVFKVWCSELPSRLVDTCKHEGREGGMKYFAIDNAQRLLTLDEIKRLS